MIVKENIDFKRTRDSKRSLDVGIKVKNRDRDIRLKNFLEDNPEVKLAYNSESHLHGTSPEPFWQILNISLSNSLNDLKTNEKKYLKWAKDNTDFDIIIPNPDNHQREYHPWGNEKYQKVYDQSIHIMMRNEEDIG